MQLTNSLCALTSRQTHTSWYTSHILCTNHLWHSIKNIATAYKRWCAVVGYALVPFVSWVWASSPLFLSIAQWCVYRLPWKFNITHRIFRAPCVWRHGYCATFELILEHTQHSIATVLVPARCSWTSWGWMARHSELQRISLHRHPHTSSSSKVVGSTYFRGDLS